MDRQKTIDTLKKARKHIEEGELEYGLGLMDGTILYLESDLEKKKKSSIIQEIHFDGEWAPKNDGPEDDLSLSFIL